MTDESSWTCTCGETHEAPFEQCWNCGAERGATKKRRKRLSPEPVFEATGEETFLQGLARTVLNIAFGAPRKGRPRTELEPGFFGSSHRRQK